MSNFNTPFDDSFRTLLTDCKRLVVPLVNEMFGTHLSESETVELYQNEFFITSGNDAKRITDSNFTIGSLSRRYHIECQSSLDGTMTLRIFEYASQIAITTAESSVSETVFTMPSSGIIYLRCNENTPEYHKIVVRTPGGDVSYKVPVLKTKDYTLEELLEKRLFFLLPYYFFNYPLDELEQDNKKIDEMKATYLNLWEDLEKLVLQGKLTEFEKTAIKAMCDKVAQALVQKFKNVKEGVDGVMGGAVLDYEAKRIYNEAYNEASEKEEIKAIVNMLKLNVDAEKVKALYPNRFDEGKKIFEETK